MRIISGIAKGRRLKSLNVDGLRPTSDRVKESLFNMIAPYINDEQLVGDFYAGTGNVGIEFLSRGVKEVIFVEMNQKCINIIKDNLKIADFQKKAKVLRYDVIKFIQSARCPKFDIVFIDPPYRTKFAKLTMENIIKYDIIKPNGLIIMETIKDFEFTDKKINLYRERVYGDTKLTIYFYGGRQVEDWSISW